MYRVADVETTIFFSTSVFLLVAGTILPFPKVCAPKGLPFIAPEFTTACRLVCNGLFSSDNGNFTRLLYMYKRMMLLRKTASPLDTLGGQRTSRINLHAAFSVLS
jgi:hypothetical protein